MRMAYTCNRTGRIFEVGFIYLCIWAFIQEERLFTEQLLTKLIALGMEDLTDRRLAPPTDV